MTPTLRFPEFAGAWQPKHGDDAFKSRRQRAKEGLPLYSVTMDQGMVRRDSLDREFASNAPDEANLRVFKDDHVYNMMRMWQGAVGRAPEDCMVSPAYVVLQPEPDTVPAFFDHWFKRRRSIYLLWAYSYGLTSDRLRLYARDFGRVPMALPPFDEQRRIADFLGAVDGRIKLLQRRRDALARYKAGMMQRLFDQSLRFTRDGGTAYPDWKEKRLGEIATIVGGGTPETAEDSYWGGDIPWFTPTEIKSKYLQSSARMLTSDGLKSSSAKLLPIGTLLLSTRANVGDVGIARQECTTNQGFQSLIMKGEHFNEFWYQWILHHKKKFVRWAAGSTFLEINKTEVGKIKAETPHPDEQRKIADALSALDDKIAAVSDQVKHMQTFKKGLLQQMFV